MSPSAESTPFTGFNDTNATICIRKNYFIAFTFTVYKILLKTMIVP